MPAFAGRTHLVRNHNCAVFKKQSPGSFLTDLLDLTLKDWANFLLLSKMNHAILPVGNLEVGPSVKEKPDVLQGTLALMVLKTLDVLGPQHGYGIARRIEQISGDVLAVNQGTLYPLLLKLENEGSIASQWGASENNRRARFYRLTATGRKQLQAETRDWNQTAAIIARFFEVKAEDLP
jgi:PadR family transcriptional regulator, regulatory protein PadR